MSERSLIEAIQAKGWVFEAQLAKYISDLWMLRRTDYRQYVDSTLALVEVFLPDAIKKNLGIDLDALKDEVVRKIDEASRQMRSLIGFKRGRRLRLTRAQLEISAADMLLSRTISALWEQGYLIRRSEFLKEEI